MSQHHRDMTPNQLHQNLLLLRHRQSGKTPRQAEFVCLRGVLAATPRRWQNPAKHRGYRFGRCVRAQCRQLQSKRGQGGPVQGSSGVEQLQSLLNRQRRQPHSRHALQVSVGEPSTHPFGRFP